MGAYRLAEIAVNLIEAKIKAEIATALANVRSERNDPVVTTEPPKEYFQYPTAHAYRCPTVFTILRKMDIRNQEMGANHINAIHDMVVAVVVEDRTEPRLLKKAWRYQSALMQILHEVSLTTSDNAVRLFSRVQNCEFSGIVNLKDDDSPGAVFRKEMSLELQVEHIENLE